MTMPASCVWSDAAGATGEGSMDQTTANDLDDIFTTETVGLPEVSHPSVIRLHDGDYFDPLRVTGAVLPWRHTAQFAPSVAAAVGVELRLPAAAGRRRQ